MWTAGLFAAASFVETMGFGHLGAFTPLYLRDLGVDADAIPQWTGILAGASFILGLPLVGASRAAILSTFEPASTVLLAVIILGETASPLQWMGGALIIASVLVLEGPGWRASRVLAQATRE